MRYTLEKEYTDKQLKDLCIQAENEYQVFPDKLYKGLAYSSYVLAAYNENQLVGLIRVLDDKYLKATIQDIIIDKNYLSIKDKMIEMILQHYQEYYLVVDETGKILYKNNNYK